MASKQNKDKKDSSTEIVKINKWDGSAVKNAIDDAIKEVVTTRLQCDESFALMDGRLAICGLAVGVAGYALLWDYLHPFPESRAILIICVASYFVLMGILTLYTTIKEKGIFVVATSKGSSSYKHLEASSNLKKYDDKYTLSLVLKDLSTGKTREGSVTKSVANFVDVNGMIVPDVVENEVVKLYTAITNKKDK